MVTDWNNVLAQLDAEQSPTLEHASSKLEGIAAALGSNDPHIKYGLSVKPHPPLPAEHGVPGLIASQTIQVDTGYVTAFSYAKYRGATNDAADRLTVAFTIRDGETADAIQELVDYGGESVVIPAEDLIELHLPQLASRDRGAPGPGGEVILAGRNFNPGTQLRLAIRPEGDELALPTMVVLDSVRTMPGARGGKTLFRSKAGCLSLTFRLAVGETPKVDATLDDDFRGKAVENIVADLPLLWALRPGMTIDVLSPTSADTIDSMPVRGLHSDERWLTFLEALLCIQRFTNDKIIFPTNPIPMDQFEATIKSGAMLAGSQVTDPMTGSRWTLNSLPPDAFGPGADNDIESMWGVTLQTNIDSVFNLPEQSVRLRGRWVEDKTFRSVRISEVSASAEHPDKFDVVIEPAIYDLAITGLRQVRQGHEIDDSAIHDQMKRTEALSEQELSLAMRAFLRQ